jgi:predicted metal-dependent HD superfamily phosphohydrolase
MYENEFLKSEWTKLLSLFTEDSVLTDKFYNQIVTDYTASTRHYHNISHIQNMLLCADKLKSLSINYQLILFSVWYHDVVYVPLKTNNEEQSYEYAKKHLIQIKIGREKLHVIKELILSTKNHCVRNKSDSMDIKLLQDADLQIFSCDREKYKIYMQQIREEYKMVPEFVYRPKRKKVIKTFLSMNHIYRVPVFREENEAKARENLNYELDCLL